MSPRSQARRLGTELAGEGAAGVVALQQAGPVYRAHMPDNAHAAVLGSSWVR